MVTQILKYPEEKFWKMTPKEIVVRAKIQMKYKTDNEDDIAYIDEIF